jgi:hypothetical protein
MASTNVRREISAQVGLMLEHPSTGAIGNGRIEAELIGSASVAVQEVGIDKSREDRFNLGRFQSPQPAGLFRSHAQVWRVLELLANDLDPITNPAGAASD